MIVATAGHVDHGKTALIHALTGIDTDRLPEEKKRGLSIDLGFAYRDLGDAKVLGFVDVPGHEKFIRNMLAGVGSVDCVMLVIAADDGPMPQTREHLAILDLLAVKQGAVVLSKIDVVSPKRRAQVTGEIRSLVAGTMLAGAQLFAVSTVTGEGIEDLKRHMENEARRFEPRAPAGNFRLAVDRSFTVPGAGLVVTGSVFSGVVNQGDHLFVLSSLTRVRVRTIHAQNRKAMTGRMGERCALNLAGANLASADIRRGDWLVAESAAYTTRRLDVRIKVPEKGEPLKHWTPAHLHLAAADVTCRIALLQDDSIAPGHWQWARLYADQELGAVRSDRFILRDQSAKETIAGGRVIDPLPPLRGRTSPARLAYLEAMDEPDAGRALIRALAVTPQGVDLAAFTRICNLTPQQFAQIREQAGIIEAGGGDVHWGIDEDHWELLQAHLARAIDDWHARYPERLGASADQLGRSLPQRFESVLVMAALTALVSRGSVARCGAVFHRPQHRAKFSCDDDVLWRRILPILCTDGLRPPPLGDLAEELGMPLREIDTFLSRAAGMGLVVQVAKNRYFPPPTIRALAAIAGTLASEDNLTTSMFRDRTGIGRNLVIQVLEFFDRMRFTLREGEHRRILLPASSVFGSDDAEYVGASQD